MYYIYINNNNINNSNNINNNNNNNYYYIYITSKNNNCYNAWLTTNYDPWDDTMRWLPPNISKAWWANEGVNQQVPNVPSMVYLHMSSHIETPNMIQV